MKYLWLALMLAGCVQHPASVPITVPPSATVAAPWPAVYTAFSVKAIAELGQPLLATQYADSARWCAPMSTASWVALMSKLAEYESSWKADNVYTESFKDAKGNLVQSIGLFQMSPTDHAIYGCEAATPQDFKDPEKNIRCAIRAFVKLTAQDKVLSGGNTAKWLGLARYWAQFRKPDRVAVMQQLTKATCTR